MDRPASAPAALPAGADDATSSGWDARTVWQQRVRDPHRAIEGKRVTPTIVLEDQSAGWDPLETWRIRVHRPRQRPG
jgi:hypothetical protein